jgi:hypothetical protein
LDHDPTTGYETQFLTLTKEVSLGKKEKKKGD